VTVQQQRRRRPRIDQPEHVRPALVRRLRHPARRSGGGLGRDLQAADAEPERVEVAGHEFLRTAFAPDGARLGDEQLEEGEGSFRARVDRRVHGSQQVAAVGLIDVLLV
jgi:hypothetical protein